MKKIMIFTLLAVWATGAQAVKLSDYSPYKFEVLFTNPVCEKYSYQRQLTSTEGERLTHKPENVYCKPSDEAASVERKNAPQYRLNEWISDPKTTELHLAYLSFSSKNIVSSLCRAAKRGVKISMVLDSGEDGENPVANKDAEGLKKCGDVNLTYRGTTGGLGFAHNKIMIVNPGKEVVKLVFSSGNMTSGTSINHENWNFVTTSGKSFFAQAHQCVISAMIDAGESKQSFADHLNECRDQIRARPESDIQVFFAPVDGRKALAKVSEAAHDSESIQAMSHRLSGALAKLYSDLLAQGTPIKFILDDDIYWAHKLRKDVGRNTSVEAFKIYNDLIDKGMETRFLQTNQNVFQLQHNKFMIFNFKSTGAVFTGAGNFTTAAFSKNFENFYYITIPEVVENYQAQYELYFEEMASSPEEMPTVYELP